MEILEKETRHVATMERMKRTLMPMSLDLGRESRRVFCTLNCETWNLTGWDLSFILF